MKHMSKTAENPETGKAENSTPGSQGGIAELTLAVVQGLGGIMSGKAASGVTDAKELKGLITGDNIFSLLDGAFGKNGAVNSQNEIIKGAFSEKGTITESIKGISKNLDTIVNSLKKPAEKGKGKGKNVTVQMMANDNLKQFLTALNELDPEIVKKINDIAEALNKLNTVDISNFTKQQNDLAAGMTQAGTNLQAANSMTDNVAEGTMTACGKMKNATAKFTEITKQMKEMMSVANSALDSKAIAEIMEKSTSLAAAIAMMGLVLYIGAAVIKKHPWVPAYAMMFTSVLTQFLASVLIPIALCSIVAGLTKSGSLNFAQIGVFITIATAVMFIGALVIKKHPDMIEATYTFMQILNDFIMEVGLSCALICALAGLTHVSSDVLKEMSSMIVTCALVMSIGALFILIGGGKFASYAIAFAQLLGIFITTVLTSITLATLFTSFRDGTIEAMVKLIVTCTIIMSIGALFIAIGGGKFATYAIAFGQLLGEFILIVVGDINLASMGMALRFATVFALQGLVATLALTMIIGALFVMFGGGKFVLSAIVFGLILGVYTGIIIGVIHIIMSFLEVNPEVAVVVMGYASIIRALTFTLLIGALFLTIAGPAGYVAVVAFAIVMEIYTAIMIGILEEITVSVGPEQQVIVGDYALLVEALGSTLLIGTLLFTLYPEAAAYATLFCVVMAAFIGEFIIMFKIINKQASTITEGGLIAIELSAAIAILAGALTIAVLGLSAAGKPLDALWYSQIFALVALEFVGMMALIGIPQVSACTALGALVAIELSAAVGILAIALAIAVAGLKQAGSPKDALKYSQIFSLTVAEMTAIMAIVAAASIPIGIGSGVAILLSGGIACVALALQEVVKVADQASKVKGNAMNKAIDILKRVLSMESEGDNAGIFGVICSVSIWDIPEIKSKSRNISEAIIPICSALGFAAGTIQMLAMLKVPTEFDKDGNAIAFKQLKGKDFDMACENMLTLLKTLVDGLNYTMTKLPPWFLIPQVSLGGLFFKVQTSNPLQQVINGLKGIVQVTRTAAEIVKDLAMAQIPVDWDKEGNPIEYRQLTVEDYAAAAVSMEFILGSLVEATIEAITQLKSNAMVWNILSTPDEEGGWFTSDKPSEFHTVITGLQGITDVLSKATGVVQDFANMKVPTGYDNEGKPTGYRTVTADDTKNAMACIREVLHALPQGIIDFIKESKMDGTFRYFEDVKNFWGNPKEGTSDFMIVCNGLSKIGELMGNSTELIQLFTVGIPTKWDDQGNPDYSSAVMPDISKVNSNIRSLLGALPNGIVDWLQSGGQREFEYDGDEYTVIDFMGEESDCANAVFDGYARMAELVSSVTKIICDYMNMKVPTGYDKDGNATGWIALDKALLFVPYNIRRIMTVIPDAVTSGIIEAMWCSEDRLNEFKNAMDISASILTTIANTLVNISTLKYKGKDDKGQEVEIAMSLTDLVTASQNIQLILEAFPTAFAKTAKLWDEDLVENCINMQDAMPTVQNTLVKVMALVTTLSASYDAKTMWDTLNAINGYASILVAVSALFGADTDRSLPVTNIFFLRVRQMYNFLNEADTDLLGTSKLMKKFEQFRHILRHLGGLNRMLEISKPEILFVEAKGIHAIQHAIESANDEQTLAFQIETLELSAFVKTVNTLKLQSSTQLTKLIHEMNNLASHVGNLDEFTKVLSEKIAKVLNDLTQQIKDAKVVIKDAERVQNKRHQLINASIERVSAMMDKPLTVEVKSGDDGTTGSEGES